MEQHLRYPSPQVRAWNCCAGEAQSAGEGNGGAPFPEGEAAVRIANRGLEHGAADQLGLTAQRHLSARANSFPAVSSATAGCISTKPGPTSLRFSPPSLPAMDGLVQSIPKKLGEALEPHRMQMLNYSNASGVAFSGLTDGNHWELYDVFRKDTLDKRRVLELSISDTPAHKCALELLLLWRPNLASGEPIEANKPVITVSPPVEQTNPIEQTNENQQPPTPANNEGWTSLSGFQPGTKGKPPSRIRLPDDEERPIQGWRYILMEVAEWLIRTEKLTGDKFPLASGRTRYLVHNETKHSNGSDFGSPQQLSNGLFLETHFSADRVAKTTRFLLEHFGEDAAAVWLKFN